ncbi:uncharacterized protein LDX57_007898 [Aspergillus melleus]|uniref:uncharacterized protein n=1 Tax=Aspergillus melleus TaxID=138277 RepID=UPI001E8DDC8B|nr:uncharacterized protein LDX57_007898 [Aspergillus melleus]KAH8430229.1 hypothetical protein LDX57_007898 [Aspergillus melleus]
MAVVLRVITANIGKPLCSTQPVAHVHGGAQAVRAHERPYSKAPGFNRLWVYRQADG